MFKIVQMLRISKYNVGGDTDSEVVKDVDVRDDVDVDDSGVVKDVDVVVVKDVDVLKMSMSLMLEICVM